MKTEPTQEMEKKICLTFTQKHYGVVQFDLQYGHDILTFRFSQQWDGCCNFEALTDYILDIELGDSYAFLFPYFLFAFEERMKIYSSSLRNVTLFS